MPTSSLKVAVARQLSKRFPGLWLEFELRYRPHHFEEELHLVPLLCQKDKTAIDIGANMGFYAYSMAKWSRRVVAFEPNADLWQPLRHLVGEKLQLEGIALSREASMATLRLDCINTGIATIERNNNLACIADPSAVVTRTVETRTLDSFGFSNISLIKIDVEGHEGAVLEGALNTIERNQPALLIEAEERHNPGALERVVAILSELHYAAFFIKHRHLLDVSSLTPADTNPANVDNRETPYINNFLFLPANRTAVVESIRRRLNSL